MSPLLWPSIAPPITRCAAAPNFPLTQHFPRCERTQRENRSHTIGSHPPLDRPQHIAQLTRPPLAMDGPNRTLASGCRCCDAARQSRHSLQCCNRGVGGFTQCGTLQTLIAFGSMAGFSIWQLQIWFRDITTSILLRALHLSG